MSMGSWTGWKMLAQGRDWFDDDLDHEGPAIYELALGGSRGGIHHIVYVGETKNLCARMTAYGQHGSHLEKEIRVHLHRGFTIYFRARTCTSKRAAVALENQYLARFDYDWNLRGVAA
jgi:hypothetical protein